MSDELRVKCPSCKKMVDLDVDCDVGDTTYCPECYQELIIRSIRPLKVDIAEYEENDFSEEEEDFEN